MNQRDQRGDNLCATRPRTTVMEAPSWNTGAATRTSLFLLLAADTQVDESGLLM